MSEIESIYILRECHGLKWVQRFNNRLGHFETWMVTGEGKKKYLEDLK